MGRKSKLETEGVSQAGNPGYVSLAATSVGNLSDIMSIRVEMSKVYKQVRRGILKIHEGNQLIYMLSQIVFAARAEIETKKPDEQNQNIPEQPDFNRVYDILGERKKQESSKGISVPPLQN